MRLTAKHVTTITVVDPDSGGDVEVDIYKEPAGGMFGVDGSYLEQVLGDDEPIISVFGNGRVWLED